MLALDGQAEAPRSFGDPRAEHLATRRASGLFDFSFMALVEISGRDALDFLGRLQTRVPARVAPGRLAYTLLLREDGAVLVDATLWRHADGRWWLFTGRRTDSAWVAQQAAAYDVRLAERSADYAVLALQGPESGRAIARLIGRDTVGRLAYFAFMEARLAALPATIGRLGYSGELGYEILVASADAAAAWAALLDAGRSCGTRECGFEAADSLRIEAGYVLFGREISGRETPAELCLQRLVERPVRALHPLRRRLVGLALPARPASAAASAALPLARITSECRSPVLGGSIALGYVSPGDAAPGTTLRVADGRLARVARLPFYDPGRRLPRATPL